MICITLDCVSLTLSGVSMRSEVFFTYPNVCYYHWVSYIHVSQSSVKMHLRCGGIYNNHIIANYLPSVPVKNF